MSPTRPPPRMRAQTDSVLSHASANALAAPSSSASSRLPLPPPGMSPLKASRANTLPLLEEERESVPDSPDSVHSACPFSVSNNCDRVCYVCWSLQSPIDSIEYMAECFADPSSTPSSGFTSPYPSPQSTAQTTPSLSSSSSFRKPAGPTGTPKSAVWVPRMWRHRTNNSSVSSSATLQSTASTFATMDTSRSDATVATAATSVTTVSCLSLHSTHQDEPKSAAADYPAGSNGFTDAGPSDRLSSTVLDPITHRAATPLLPPSIVDPAGTRDQKARGLSSSSTKPTLAYPKPELGLGLGPSSGSTESVSNPHNYPKPVPIRSPTPSRRNSSNLARESADTCVRVPSNSSASSASNFPYETLFDAAVRGSRSAISATSSCLASASTLPPLSPEQSLRQQPPVSESFRASSQLPAPSPGTALSPAPGDDYSARLDERWSGRLGHCNVSIHPSPFLPAVRTAAVAREMFSQWERARLNFGRLEFQTAKMYGVHSDILKAVREKFAEADETWKVYYTAVYDSLAGPDADGVPRPEAQVEYRHTTHQHLSMIHSFMKDTRMRIFDGSDTIGPMHQAAPRGVPAKSRLAFWPARFGFLRELKQRFCRRVRN